MRGWRVSVASMVAAVLMVGAASVADAAADGPPVIESPVEGAAHDNGFNGPFVVDLTNAKFDTTYYYFVDQVPSGGGAPVLVGTEQTQLYDNAHTFTKPQLTVTALPPGTGYTFHITDKAGHAASLPFTVLSGSPPTCSILLPSTVRMKARSFLVTARLSPTCTTLHTTYAVWKATHPVGGFAQTFTFDAVSTVYWRIYDDEYTGVYTVRPTYARNDAFEQVPQNTTRLTMKMDSRINLTASRSGSYVTLRTLSTRYSPSANRFKVWSGRRVVLSYRTCSTCAWHQLKVRTTNRYGRTSYRFKAARVRQYRATAVGTSTTWAPRPDRLTR